MSRETNYIYFVGRTDYNRMFYFEAIKNFQLNNNAIAVQFSRRTRRSWHMYDNHDWEKNRSTVYRDACPSTTSIGFESGMRSGESTPRYIYSKEITCEGLETPATWITNSSSRNMQILIIRSFICDRNKKMIFWLMIFISCHFFFSQVILPLLKRKKFIFSMSYIRIIILI